MLLFCVGKSEIIVKLLELKGLKCLRLLIDEFDTFSYSNLFNTKFKMPTVFQQLKLRSNTVLDCTGTYIFLAFAH